MIITMSDKEYFELDAFSKHDSDMFAKNPYAYFIRKITGYAKEPTEAMKLGTALHEKLLTPNLYEQKYAVVPESIKVRRGKEWDAFKEEHEGMEYIRIADFQKVSAMAKSLEDNSEVCEVFKKTPLTAREVVLTADINGVFVKSKVDMVAHQGKTLIDIKTATDASPKAFVRQAAELGYDVQAAFYIMNAEANGLKPEKFAFYVVETEFPYTTGIYTFDKESSFVRAGKLEVERRLSAYKQAVEAVEDPIGDGWSATNLKLPAWCERAQLAKILDDDTDEAGVAKNVDTAGANIAGMTALGAVIAILAGCVLAACGF